MSNGLSYPSLKCVLEHLEVNKRARITSRCPVLQKFEKTIPIHLDYLVLGCSKLIINNITYKLKTGFQTTKGSTEIKSKPFPLDEFGEKDKSVDKILMPGDICLKSLEELIEEELITDQHEGDLDWMRQNHSRISNHIFITFKVEDDDKKYKRRLPDNLEFHMAMKKLTCFFLEGRYRKIHVKNLFIEFFYQKILRAPVGLKVHTKSLHIAGAPVEALSQIIDDSSYPLEEFSVSVNNNRPNLEHPSLQTAKKLAIDLYKPEALLVTDLLKLRNLNIELFYFHLSLEDVMVMIQNWMENGREIGTCFTFECLERMFVVILLHKIRKRFNGKVVNLEERDRRSFKTTHCISLPMSSTSKLVIYGEDYCSTMQVKMQVRQIEATTTQIKNNVPYYSKAFWISL